MAKDRRRTQYDHEPAYREIAARGGRGWDDLSPGAGASDSYAALEAFLVSDACPAVNKNSRAIDLGCGGGQVAIRLAQRGFQVLAIDYSETAIELAKRNACDANVSVECIVGDCVDLADIPDDAFDIAIDNHTLHCLTSPQTRAAFLRNAHRVLKPGGVLHSETMSREGAFDPNAFDVGRRTWVDRSNTRYWTTSGELRALFEQSGFTILSQTRRPQPDTPPPGDTIVIHACA